MYSSPCLFGNRDFNGGDGRGKQTRKNTAFVCFSYQLPVSISKYPILSM